MLPLEYLNSPTLHLSNSNEKMLLSRFVQGDEASFRKLYELYSERIFLYLIRLTKSEDTATDILQEVFIKIWNSRGQIDLEQSFRSYLFKTAENCVYDFFRKTARDKKLREAFIQKTLGYYDPVEVALLTKENRELLHRTIEALPPKRRQVFHLVKIEERSYEEVSSLLQMSTSTVNDHIVKATKFIRERMQTHCLASISTIFIFMI